MVRKLIVIYIIDIYYSHYSNDSLYLHASLVPRPFHLRGSGNEKAWLLACMLYEATCMHVVLAWEPIGEYITTIMAKCLLSNEKLMVRKNILFATMVLVAVQKL